jgi:hypothetical protein
MRRNGLFIQTLKGPIMRPLIGYFRVSTSKQGESGLGIEAQQEARAGLLRPRASILCACSDPDKNPASASHVRER